MSDPQVPARSEVGTLFLVERYLPRAAAENLPALVARTARLCGAAGISREVESAEDVHYLHSAYLPAENTCFCLFRAQSADAIRAVNKRAEFALDRITAAVLLHPDNPSSRRAARSDV